MAVVARPRAADALRLGRRRFLAPERIDMAAIAGELGVNRVTLYRWFGSRDDFVVEVVWSLALTTFRWVEDKVSSEGPERIVDVVTGFLDTIITNPGMQRWLGEDGEHAMRLLTGRQTDFQQRLIGEIQRRLEEHANTSRPALPVDLHELAYVIVRLIESYTYLDLITGERPEARRAEPILRMLLRVDS
ncbi:MAG TPA: QsdR family transcriptional regulator [Solirubrobacteraceae bacterium]|nr:QsdR family transcriptional regulator [Solirubrobacteraceae bacterium]